MTLVAAILVIPALLFIAPFVLGAFAVVQALPPRGQVAYFGFCTLFFIGVLVVAAITMLVTAI